MKLIKLLFSALLIVSLVSCADLSVENNNDPETARALTNPATLEAQATGMYADWYNSVYNLSSPAFWFASSADVLSCSWGNFGMRDSGTEPRPAFLNSTSYTNIGISSSFFNNMYSVNSSAGDIVIACENDSEFFGANTAGYLAFAKMMQGITHMNIAVTYDQGFIVDDKSSSEYLLAPTFFPYTEVAAHAKTKLEEAISIAESNTFNLGDQLIDGNEVDNVLLAKIAHSYLARLLANTPRNSSEAASVDWASVRDHAAAGMDVDLGVLSDYSGGNIYNYFLDYATYPGWGRVDMRVINKLDDSYPATNPNGDDFPAPVAGPGKDARLTNPDYFQHLSSNNFPPERGLYFYTSFRSSKYSGLNNDSYQSVTEIGASEMDLLEAEARLWLGDVPGAAALVNAGTRITNGELAPVAANATDVLGAIEHELVAEYNISIFGLNYFFMRRHDQLQIGTMLHFPVPANTLETMGEVQPFYTFGGVENADGVNTSNGGWQ